MDMFGIGAACLGAYQSVCLAMRGTGRTTRMIESLGKNDRVVFLTAKEAEHAKHIAGKHGKGLNAVVCSPKKVEELFNKGTALGRVHFDHHWLEEYYALRIRGAMRDIRNLQYQLSGVGEQHRWTAEMARMSQRFNVDMNLANPASGEG